MAYHLGFAQKRVRRRFLISNISAGNITLRVAQTRRSPSDLSPMTRGKSLSRRWVTALNGKPSQVKVTRQAVKNRPGTNALEESDSASLCLRLETLIENEIFHSGMRLKCRRGRFRQQTASQHSSVHDKKGPRRGAMEDRRLWPSEVRMIVFFKHCSKFPVHYTAERETASQATRLVIQFNTGLDLGTKKTRGYLQTNGRFCVNLEERAIPHGR